MPTDTYDLVIYGGTCAGVTAAIAADRMGLRTILVSPDDNLGGLTSNGLGWTDSKDEKAIGGLSREFFHRIWKHYREPAAWTRTNRDEYAARVHAQPGKTIDDDKQVMWTFEPKVAEQVFDQMLAETKVTVLRDEWLDRSSGGVEVSNGRIAAIRMLSGKVIRGAMFIDATYEGDLMAAAGVTHRIGRDANAEFGETLNGIFFKTPGMTYNSNDKWAAIDPYVVPGDPKSGFVAGIEGELPAGQKLGDADDRLQSFNYRLCMSAVPENRIAIDKPAGYDEKQYELMLRAYEAGHDSGFSTQEMPNGKTDSNNTGMVSFDFIGGSAGYSEGSYEQRKQITANHQAYQRGLLWTLMNHPRVPEAKRREWAKWGLAADEFTDNGGWPKQIYVREARRMVGEMVMTEHHVKLAAGYAIDDSIGQGSYSLDSHGIRRVVVNGKILVEGGFYVWHDKPYPISYRAIVPKRNEIQNLLVPVTLSATHAAFGSIRMEPTYMILGHSAAVAASLAIRGKTSVQDVQYERLKRELIEQKQVL
jgi:hypothetical protein